MRLTRAQSPAARRIGLQARRDALRYDAARRAVWPNLGLDLAAPDLSREFSVGLQTSTQPDTATGQPVLQSVYVKTTTTSRNASGSVRARQLLPWHGSVSALGAVVYRDETTTPTGVRAARRDYQVATSIGLDVPLLGDDPERRSLHRAAVEQVRNRSVERTSNAQLEFDAVARYLDLLHARMALEIVQAAATAAAQSYEVTRRKVTAGLLPDVERLKTEVYRAERDARLAEQQSQLARSEDEFKVFLGLPLADSLRLVEILEPFAAPDSAAPWLERARRERDDVGLVEAEVALLERDRLAHRPRVPTVDLALRYGGGANESELDRALDGLSANAMSALVTLHVPLWDGGRASRTDGADATEIALRRLDAADASSRLELEVRDAVRQMQDAARRHAVLAAASRLADELQRIDGERYERGLIDTQRYLAGQVDAATARLGSAEALLDLYRARARLRFVALSEE